MTSFQIGLVIAGVVLVAGVVLYNAWQERRVRKRIDAAFAPRAATGDALLDAARPAPSATGQRVEPSLNADDLAAQGPAPPPVVATTAPQPSAAVPDDDDYSPPVEVIRSSPSVNVAAPVATRTPDDGGKAIPDPDIESIVTLQPVRPMGAGVLAAGLHARLGKPLRWFGRRANGAWQLLAADTQGEFDQFAACLLLADRSGAASAPLLDAFVRLVGEVAASLPAAFVPPDPGSEAERAEALDRICADLDVQIGLTILKSGPATIAGTRLRGVAEAAGFRLAEGGRFECIHEETGATLYALQNLRAEPFSVETLRLLATPGAVFLLDVPRVGDPARVFDQMKLVAKRMAQTLDAALVDDNRRTLDDAALTAIRQQIVTTAAALHDVHIDPGSPRALALFGG
jgi:hypothetical protein